MLGGGQGAELALSRRKGARERRKVKGEGEGQQGRGGRGRVGKGKGERERERAEERTRGMKSKGKYREEGSRKRQGAPTSHPGARSMVSNGIEGRKPKLCVSSSLSFLALTCSASKLPSGTPVPPARLPDLGLRRPSERESWARPWPQHPHRRHREEGQRPQPSLQCASDLGPRT